MRKRVNPERHQLQCGFPNYHCLCTDTHAEFVLQFFLMFCSFWYPANLYNGILCHWKTPWRLSRVIWLCSIIKWSNRNLWYLLKFIMTYICLKKRPWPGEPPWWGCSGLGGWAARGWCACRSSALLATPNQPVKLLLAFVVCCITPDVSAVLAPVRSGDKAWRQIKDLGNWSLTVQHSLTIITIISLNHSHQCRELHRNLIQQSCTFPERLKDLLGFLKKPLKSMQIILRNSNLNLLISCAPFTHCKTP